MKGMMKYKVMVGFIAVVALMSYINALQIKSYRAKIANESQIKVVVNINE
jgi:hypothetical protein